MGTIAIFGATSGIAQAVAEELLRKNYSLVLCGRDSQSLERLARDFNTKYSRDVDKVILDILKVEEIEKIIQSLTHSYSIEGAMIFIGTLVDQEKCEQDYTKSILTMNTNLTGPILLMNALIPYYKEKKGGFISCISSVAGDRGRGSNFIYGSSKSGLSTYLQGLRQKLAPYDVLVQTIKPGMVRTPMTSHIKDSPLFANPQKVARDIVGALVKKKEVVYTPSYWRPIMGIIKSMPEFIFKRLKL